MVSQESQQFANPDISTPRPPGWTLGRCDWVAGAGVLLYVVLSLADIALTYLLLGYHRHVEANPIARYFIEGWGVKGMVGFKLSMVVVVVVLAHAIGQSRPQVARGVVRLGVIIVGAVVFYSLWRLLQASA